METTGRLLQVLYTSRAAEGVAASESFSIVATSERENARQSITGFLLEHDGRFLQFLEGPPLGVEALMARIERDPRHSHVDIRFRAGDEKRCFPDWSMKRLLSFSSRPALEELREVLSDRPCGPAILEAVTKFIGD